MPWSSRPSRSRTTALVVALRAARLCGDHPAGASLLEWLESFPPGPRRWDDATRTEFVLLLQRAEPSSLRLLTASGVLQRALPELDDAIAGLRPAALEIDPLATLRLPRLTRVREIFAATSRPFSNRCCSRRWCSTRPATTRAVRSAFARRTVQRLDLRTRVEQAVAGLVDDAGLLNAAARRSDGLSEESVLRIAVHLGTSEQAEALFVLSLAGQEEGTRSEERLWALHKLLQAVLTKQELVGREAANEVERRRTEARSWFRTTRSADASLRRHGRMC